MFIFFDSDFLGYFRILLLSAEGIYFKYTRNLYQPSAKFCFKQGTLGYKLNGELEQHDHQLYPLIVRLQVTCKGYNWLRLIEGVTVFDFKIFSF